MAVLPGRKVAGQPSVTAAGPTGGEYPTFAIDRQTYGIDILSVREIRLDRSHLSAGHARLRARHHQPARQAVIVVVAANGTFGLLVDSVSDIPSIDRREERMVSIIDLDRLPNVIAATALAEVVAVRTAQG